MTDKLAEELSALLDDEAEEFSTRRILKEMERGSELQEKWDRYCLIRDQLQKSMVAGNEAKPQLKPKLKTDFAAQISMAIKDEPTYHRRPAAGAVTEDCVETPAVAQYPGKEAEVDNVARLPQPKKASWTRRYGAVASVVFLALVVFQLFQFNGSSDIVHPATSVALNLSEANSLMRVDNKARVGVATVRNVAKMSSAGLPGRGPNKLDGYFRIHSEQSALGSSRGMMPYARVIHYQEIH